jgi:DNA-binding IclR family transcriptional regulator
MSRDRYGRSGQPTTVEGALDILESVARFGTGVTAKEIAGHLGMPPATCYRLLNNLVASEHLVRVDDLHGFALGRRIDDLLTVAAPPFIPTAARDVLAQLRGSVRFGVHLVVYLGTTARVADADPDQPMRSAHHLQRSPHATAAGKLMLAHLGDWRPVVPGLSRVTPRTITDPDVLSARLDEIRRTGVAWAIGESAEDTACLAVPVCSRSGTAVGAVCLAGPVARAEALAGHLEAARATARALATLIA